MEFFRRSDGMAAHCNAGSSPAAVPVAPQAIFASVHRPRHASTAIKRAGDAAQQTKTTTVTAALIHSAPSNSASAMGAEVGGSAAAKSASQTSNRQRPSYQQYQQQRRRQQHQQQQARDGQVQRQQLLYLQQHNGGATAAALYAGHQPKEKAPKARPIAAEWQSQQQQQQQHYQQHSSMPMQTQSTATTMRQSIAVAIPQPPPPMGAQQQPYDVSPTKHSRIPVQQQSQQQHYQQQQQQQQYYQQQHQYQQQQAMHQSSQQQAPAQRLNDIYERHLLSQTTFGTDEGDGQTRGRAYSNGVPVHAGGHADAGARRQQPLHFLKLPPPPPPCQDIESHFQFSDAYAATPPSNRQKHFLLAAQLPPGPPQPTEQPPPPPTAPVNHVYETIKERRRSPLPPPLLVERPSKAERELQELPPLPPARQPKKRVSAGGTAARAAKAGSLKKSGDAQSPRRGKPPAYVAPPGATAANNTNKQCDYNPLQRTKADGEQKPHAHRQQLLEQAAVTVSLAKLKPSVQLQHLQQLEQHPLELPTAPKERPREQPLGAHNNKMGEPDAAAHFNAGHLSVEQTLQQVGLLPPPSTASAAASARQCHRPTALPIVFEEVVGEYAGDVVVLEEDGATAKLPYRHGAIEMRLETAQAMAAAAYYARAAQKLAAQSSGAAAAGTKASRANELTAQAGSSAAASAATTSTRHGGFCGALQRAPPPMPPGLARRLANKENFGIGKVKVMLRVSDAHTTTAASASEQATDTPSILAVDKKKRQVTLSDPASAAAAAACATTGSQERGPMVAAPKMFAFDSLFTGDDQQSDVCSSALSEVIPAVLEGSDGCLLTIGYPSCGQGRTMLGSAATPPAELGAIPCAIAWLYKGINERRQKSGARFSVRVSALGVSAHSNNNSGSNSKDAQSAKDLLAAHATESDDSPGVYLRDDFLGGPTELRAPTAERAALFLDAALAGRPPLGASGLEPAMIFTLHVYQYSLSRKGGVAGGRSRLHLIDLGGCANRSGGLPLSGIGNILLAILSGQRHPPNKDHPLTPLLKDCLAPLTCHVAIMAHVTHTQSHTDALTTVQLASRIHRMRRRKHRFPLSGAEKAGATGGLAPGMNGGHQSTGSSAGSGADPSSSELSADTVIYMGPSDDATDGEHPPVYLPSLSSGDNRGVMSKVLKGSGLERPTPPQSPAKQSPAKKAALQSPAHGASNRTGSLKRVGNNAHTQPTAGPLVAAVQSPAVPGSPKIVAGTLRHPGVVLMCSKGSNVPSPKGSPLRRPGVGVAANSELVVADSPGSPLRKLSSATTEEQWIDGPRVSRAKVAEARHLLREVNHVKQCETWIDGPKSQSSRSLTAGNLPVAPSQVQGYGFMDSHKKSMIRQWVENQTTQVFQTSSAASSPTHITSHHRDQQAQHLRSITYHMSQLKQKSLDASEDIYAVSSRQQQPGATPLEPLSSGVELTSGLSSATNASAPANYHHQRQQSYEGIQRVPPIFNSQHGHNKDETDVHSTHSLQAGFTHIATTSTPAFLFDPQPGTGERQAATGEDEDQDSGPSEVPPALPLIEPLGSREISHESLHRILSRHVSRESLFQQQQQELRRQEERQHYAHSQHGSMGMSDCGLQVTEEEIARTMAGEHPLAALSHCENMSIVSSFNMGGGGDAFSDCALGERTRNQFDQLARLREIFTSQLAMAEVTPVMYRNACDIGSVYSEPAYRFNTGPGSVCSEPPYRPPSPRQPSRSPSQGSLPSLNGIMQIAGMEQYASLRHPDGASDPNLPKVEKPFILEHEDITEVDEKTALLSPSKRPSLEATHAVPEDLPLVVQQSQLPLLPLNSSTNHACSEAYDSGHDSSTPRTSKHSGISRRAESGYHSVATARDSDESSFTSGLSKEHHNRIVLPSHKKPKRPEKGLCTWLMNPFTCTYPETEGEISDF